MGKRPGGLIRRVEEGEGGKNGIVREAEMNLRELPDQDDTQRPKALIHDGFLCSHIFKCRGETATSCVESLIRSLIVWIQSYDFIKRVITESSRGGETLPGCTPVSLIACL
jgi:hypothetical protein